jgi:hypothetical protein
VNPYVATALAMCVIVLISLVGTAWLASHFNRKGKADLRLKLEPLAAAIDGELELEEATVSGRYRGQLSEGRMANATDGPGRVFFARVIDAAGGVKWRWTISAPKLATDPREVSFECADPAIAARIEADLPALAQPLVDMPGWTRIEYDPEAGHVRLTKPMRTRHDIPDAERFLAQLETLIAIGEFNRQVMQPDAAGER